MPDAITSYFDRLAEFSHDFLYKLPLQRRPQSIREVMGTLQPALEDARPAAVRELRALERPAPQMRASVSPGMNTVGLLADRLAILCIKTWNVRNKQGDAEAAETLRTAHVGQIVRCMAECTPGEKDLLKKVTKLTSDLELSSWEESYYGILASNILLWEAQEVLYLKDLNVVPCEELRDYIKWFSYGNIDRNKCISACEEFYWTPSSSARGGAAT